MRAITDKEEDAMAQYKDQDNVNRLMLRLRVLDEEENHRGNGKKLTYLLERESIGIDMGISKLLLSPMMYAAQTVEHIISYSI